jgi:uncharacterized repeat protein (TIGR02543 family)
MKKICTYLCLALFISLMQATVSFGADYPYGIMPNGASVSDAQSYWNTYKNQHVTTTGVPDPSTMVRSTSDVADGSNSTETFAYAMVAAAALESNDDLLTKLRNYIEHYAYDNGLYCAVLNADGSVGKGGGPASDMQVDAAIAYDIAAQRWGGEWNQIAVDFINVVKAHRGMWNTLRGDNFGCYINYIAFGYFKRYHLRTNDDHWTTNVIDASYNTMLQYSYDNYKLPAWYVNYLTGVMGKPNDPWSSGGDRFDAGPSRSGWRIPTHYLATGNNKSLQWGQKMSTFFSNKLGGQHVSNLKTGFNPSDGSGYGGKGRPTTIGAAGVSAMAAGNQTIANQAYDWLTNTYNQGSHGLDDGIALMCIMTMSGALAPYLTSNDAGPYYPEVEFTNLTNGGSLSTGDVNVSISATDPDPSGSVQKVELYSNGSKIDEKTSAPYDFTIPGVSQSILRLEAHATDNSGWTKVEDITVYVGDESALRPYLGTAFTIPGTIEAEHYDLGGQDVTYHDATPGQERPSGIREDQDVDVQLFTGATSDYGIGFTLNGTYGEPEWTEYTINASQTAYYDISFFGTAFKPEREVSMYIDGTKVIGPTQIPEAASYKYPDFIEYSSFPSVEITEGEHIFRLEWSLGSFNIDWIKFSSGSIPDQYTLNVNATNGNVTLDPAGGTYSDGTTVTMTAEPADGYIFSGWTGSISGADNPVDIIMNNNKTVQANFTEIGQVPTAYKTNSTITIDGNITEGDWNLEFPVANQIDQVGNSDNTMSFGVLWDNTNLYIAAEILDADLHYDAGLQNHVNDGMEVYLDANNNKAVSYDGNDWQILKHYSTGTSAPIIASGGSITGIQAATTNISGGYAVEFAIPWANTGIDNAPPSIGEIIGLDIGCNDNDNGSSRAGQLMWNHSGTNTNWSDPSGFGEMLLEDATQINTSDIANNILIAPNPVVDQLNILDVDVSSVQISNIAGEIVLINNNVSADGSISVGNLNNGIYIIKITTEDGKVYVNKLIKSDQ